MKRPYAVFFVLVMLFATFALSLAACNDNTGGTTQDDASAVQDPDDTETPSTDDPSSDDDTDTDDEATYIYYKPVQGYDYTEGDEIEHITYYSSVAGADKHANVILPVDYDPEKSYPVLYLLHGLMSDEYSWIDGVYGLEMGANYMQFSRIYDGKNFIYSFYVSEDVLLVSTDHSNVRRIPVKSRHISSATEEQKDNEQGPRLNLELARYGDLIYDPYRNTYYRFAYPKTLLDRNMNWWGKAVYGRNKFSVIILDENFNIIGETLFPEGIYNSYVFFVHKDGLYISRDYQIGNGNQSGDYMTFELFKLIEKK